MIPLSPKQRFQTKNFASNFFVKIVLLILGIIYVISSFLPKHADFWIFNTLASRYWLDPLHFYQNELSTALYPPLLPATFYAIQGIWYNLGSYILHYNFIDFYHVTGASITIYYFWAMLPTLAALFLFVTLAYFVLNRKWVSIICFGSITFISVQIMGQIDIFCVLFIFISAILFMRALKSDNYYSLSILGFLSLGVSMQFKTYGALLFPLFILSTLAISKVKKLDLVNSILLIVIGSTFFIIATFIVWIPYPGMFGKLILGGESQWTLYYTIFDGISIWLLGMIILIYFIVREIFQNPQRFLDDERYYFFYIFIIIVWFFISVRTLPQFWMLLVPAMLFVLDKFNVKWGIWLCGLIILLFVFFPFSSQFHIAQNLELLHIPVIYLDTKMSTILITGIAGILIIWAFELKKSLLND